MPTEKIVSPLLPADRLAVIVGTPAPRLALTTRLPGAALPLDGGVPLAEHGFL